MEPILDFIGSYWWLGFFAVPIVGAIANGAREGAKRRHKRRLEIIRAKAELTSAKAAAKAKPVATASDPKPITKPSPVPTQLERLFAKHDDVTQRWLEYELDVAKLIAFPTMSDGRQPMTAAFLRAKKVADNLRPESTKVKISDRDLAEYRDSVTEYEVAFELAEREARRVKDSTFAPDERKRLDVAKQLLSVAVDQAATPAERHVAYKRVRDELDGLIALSDDAVEILEHKVALQLAPTREVPTADDAATAEPDDPSAAR